VGARQTHRGEAPRKGVRRGRGHGEELPSRVGIVGTSGRTHQSSLSAAGREVTDFRPGVRGRMGPAARGRSTLVGGDGREASRAHHAGVALPSSGTASRAG